MHFTYTLEPGVSHEMGSLQETKTHHGQTLHFIYRHMKACICPARRFLSCDKMPANLGTRWSANWNPLPGRLSLEITTELSEGAMIVSPHYKFRDTNCGAGIAGRRAQAQVHRGRDVTVWTWWTHNRERRCRLGGFIHGNIGVSPLAQVWLM